MAFGRMEPMTCCPGGGGVLVVAVAVAFVAAPSDVPAEPAASWTSDGGVEVARIC